MLAPWKKSHDKPRQRIKKQRHYYYKRLSSQGYGFSISYVWIWELDQKKKAECQRLMPSNRGAGEDSWESPGLQGDQTSQS